MTSIEPQRWTTALGRVAEIERTSTTLKSRWLPRKFTYARRSAWSTSPGLNALSEDQRPHVSGHGHTYSRIGAESVLVGKFDVEDEVRLRAFYPRYGLSLRYQTGGKRNGITRTVDAYNRVHPHAHDLMPVVYEHGTILDGKGAYLVEDTVKGQPATRGQLQEIITPLTSRLHRVHEGVGVTSKPLSKTVNRLYGERWREFVTTTSVDPQTDHAVQKLIAKDQLLEISVTHGDLVRSNILVTNDDFVLVDWEFAAMKPIAFDMAKIIINVADPTAILAEMHAGLGGKIGTATDHYRFHEQVALALVLTLTYHKNHAAKAARAGRMDALERQTTNRIQAIQQLLEIT